MAVEFKKDLLYRQLKDAILSGEYPPGSKFPREVEFAADLGVAFVTLRSALKKLEEDGLITRLRSRGTFVNDPASAQTAGESRKRKILLAIRGESHLENITVISKLQHYAEGRSVDNYTLYSADGDSCKLQDVCKEKKLVYYLSEQGCQICYQPFLEKLNDLADKIGKENIVVIAKFSEKRVFKLFLQDLDFEMKPAVYQCRTDFDIYPEYNDYAMAFLLAKDLVIDNICITDKSNTKLSGDYLKLIEKEFEEGR